jgi:hypothetical protein
MLAAAGLLEAATAALVVCEQYVEIAYGDLNAGIDGLDFRSE